MSFSPYEALMCPESSCRGAAAIFFWLHSPAEKDACVVGKLLGFCCFFSSFSCTICPEESTLFRRKDTNFMQVSGSELFLALRAIKSAAAA